MVKKNWVAICAFFWGGAVFLPVGMNYLGFLLVFGAMMLTGVFGDLPEGHLRARFQKLRSHPIWWPLVAYLGWMLIVLIARPHYPQTGINLFHGVRIALTLALAICLTPYEAKWGLRGVLVSMGLALITIAVKLALHLPDVGFMNSVAQHTGNKSIAAAALMAMISAASIVIAMDFRGVVRWLAAPLFVAVVLIVSFVNPSRISLIILLLMFLVACVHRWRRRIGPIAIAVVLAAGVAFAVVGTSDAVHNKFEKGLSEAQAAVNGRVSQDSWGVRVIMYRLTSQMMLERPIAGWGIGAWNTLWIERTPEILHDFNMPHNDFLWMGSQSGIPGALSLVAVLVACAIPGWRRKDLTGRLALMALAGLVTVDFFNSALRDAALALPLQWVLGMLLAITASRESIWPLWPIAPREPSSAK